ncbi:MAG: hypothetical protein LBF05_01985 [Tannerella sp.]|nr:hypothetical protein [Tannerella sp.]
MKDNRHVQSMQDIPGAKTVYEELKTRFPQTGRPRNASHPDASASS